MNSYRLSHLALAMTLGIVATQSQAIERNFNRIASFSICSQIDIHCDTDVETSAEILATGKFGHKLIYSNSPNNSVGFVNITDPNKPQGLGTIGLKGEPTSVAVTGIYALVGVNTSENFVNVSGHLTIINHLHQKVIHRIDLGGQPDTVAVSPDGHYAAVVIENERNEDLGDGEPPQIPAGKLAVIDMSHKNPKKWRLGRPF